MAADLLDETHDCGADALQGAEYTSDGTPCVLQMKAKCAGDAVGGTRTSEKISTFLRENRAGPSTTIKRLFWTPLDDIIRGSAALDALDSKLLRLQKNHAYRPIARKCAGCATAPVSDTSISPQVLGDDAGLYTPFEPSDFTSTQKIEQTYQIPHSPSEPTTTNDRLPTKAPKTTNGPEHGTVNATEPSRATACKGAPDDLTKSGSICHSINFLPSETIFIAPQQGTKSSIPTSQTKERPTQPLDAHGFPDICASTSTAGQAVGNDGAGGYPGGLGTPCATPIVPLATDDDVRYDCLPTDQDIRNENPTFDYATKFGHADAVEISAKNRFLDGGASRYAPRICIPILLDGKTSESPASMSLTSQTRYITGSPTYSDTTTLFDESCNLIRQEKDISIAESHISPASLAIQPTASYSIRGLQAPLDAECNDILRGTPTDVAFEADHPISSPRSPIGHHVPPELYQMILSHMNDPSFWLDVSQGSKAHTLGCLALTCRYWAAQVRYIILSDLCLKSSLGVDRMKTILRPKAASPLAQPNSLMRRLKIMHSDEDPFWIYEALSEIFSHPSLRKSLIIELNLNRYGPPIRYGTTPMPSVFFYLPRQMPFLFRQVSRLELRSMHFKRASDFFRLLGEFCHLTWLVADDISWSESSPVSPISMLPPSLLDIYVKESNRYALNGKGTLPWFISAAATHTRRHNRKKRSDSGLPAGLRSSSLSTIQLPPLGPDQMAYIMDLAFLLYSPSVSPVLEHEQEIQWLIQKIPGYNDTKQLLINILGWQACEGDKGKAVVTPSLDLIFDIRPEGFPEAALYLTRVSLNVISLKPSIEELKLYNWQDFFSAVSGLWYIEEVELVFNNAEQRRIIFEEHQTLIRSVIACAEDDGRQPCTFNYRVEGSES